jgi:hypothetical protein
MSQALGESGCGLAAATFSSATFAHVDNARHLTCWGAWA